VAGRPESPLDPDGGPVRRLAYELRKLRGEAGSPTYREMARRTGLGASTLSQAAAGERLPTLPVLLAYVEVCGGDAREWEQRWSEAYEQESVRPSDETADPPYRGLERFEPGDRDRFFGRDDLVAQLAAKVYAHRLIAVVGASGSGKSSLLRAGLLPALQAERGQGRRPGVLRILTPGPRPFSAHAALVTPGRGEGDTVVVVDQFEELFTLCEDPAERRAFLDLLLTAMAPDSRLRVVIAVRADFFARCAEHHQLADALREATLVVGPMSPAELREAIVKPAAADGLVVERSLTARIVREVAEEPGGLPLMSHALLETWRRRRGRALTEETYDAAGGIHGAISTTAEHVYTRFTVSEADAARRLLLRLVTPGEGAQDTRRPADLAELETAGHESEVVLERLVKARLLTHDGDTVDLAHEALITAWPRYRAWIEEDRDRLRLHRRLTEAARTWNDLDQDPGSLWRGTRLASAEDSFGPEHRSGLTPPECAFLTASTAARDHDTRTAARTTRRLRTLTVALSVFLALAVTASLIALNQTRTSEQARLVALSRQLAAQSSAVSGSNPDLAGLLAVAAYRTSPTAEAADSLSDAAARPLQRGLAAASSGDSIESMAVSPDGRTLATGDNKGKVWLVDTATGRRKGSFPAVVLPPRHETINGRQFTVTDDMAAALAYSPDGRTLAVRGADRVVRLWDIATHRIRVSMLGRTRTGSPLVFSPDGRSLATAGPHSTTQVWDAGTGRLRASLAGAHGLVETIAFSPDGRTLASSGLEDNGVRLWNPATHRLRTRLKAAHTRSVAFSPDGRLLATAGTDGTVRLWDTATDRVRTSLADTSHDDAYDVTFSRDGHTLAAGESGGTVRLWDMATDRLRTTLTGMRYPVGSLAFNADGTALATLTQSAVLWWDLAADNRLRTVLPRTAVGSGIAVSTTGHFLAANTRDGKILLWDTSDDKPLKTLPASIGANGHPDALIFLALSPDGHALAASSSRAVRLWNVETGRSHSLRISAAGLFPLAFSPDGHALAVGSTLSPNASRTSMQLRDVVTGHRLSTIKNAERLAFSPDGHTLALSSGNGTVRLTDRAGHPHVTLHTGIPTRSSATDSGSVRELIPSPVFSPDGHLLATPTQDGGAVLWDTRTGHLRSVLRPDEQSSIVSLAFSPDGLVLATGADDGTIALWNTVTGHSLGRVDAYPANFTSINNPRGAAPAAAIDTVAFTSDGHTLATDRFDGTAQLWDLALPTPADTMDRICHALRRNLTAQERSVYLAGQEATPGCPTV
jgi:WD40 repeat protein/transcriptional regulator with XRE-family HTH domain